MSSTIYPSVEEILYLHQQLIEIFGGSPGIRDLGLLESALARPRSGYYTSMSEQAAALMQSLVLNHCFLDGNKRIAFASMAIFLKINGIKIKVDQKEAVSFIVDQIIINKCDLEVITHWIESCIKNEAI